MAIARSYASRASTVRPAGRTISPRLVERRGDAVAVIGDLRVVVGEVPVERQRRPGFGLRLRQPAQSPQQQGEMVMGVSQVVAEDR